MSPASIEDLIQCVKDAYWQQPIETVENIFLTLQQCMEATMLLKGSNTYKLPHMGKDKMRRDGVVMPSVIPCSEEAVLAAAELC